MYEYGSIEIIYTSVLFTVLSASRYRLYKNQLRLPLKYIYVIVAVICLTGSGLWILNDGIFGIAYDTYRIIFAVIMFTLSCIIIKTPFAENIFSYAFILAFTVLAETTSFYIKLNFLSGVSDYAYLVISATIVAAAFIPGNRGLDSMITRLNELKTDRVWGWLDLACFSFLFMNLLILKPHPEQMNLNYPISRYLMFIGMIGIYKVVIRMTDVMSAVINTRAELSLSQRRISIQQNYYDRLITQMDDVRRKRHDLRQHRAVISTLIKNKDIEALSVYIDEASKTEEAIPVTGNLAVDSVMLYFIDAAGALGVQMETTLAIGSKTPLSDSDLCVILGNLLENAIDAQKFLAPEDRYIRVTAKGDEKSLTLAVDNRFDGVLISKNGVYLSRKDDEGHGVGLASVRAICEKYDGVLQIDIENGMFMAGAAIGL